MSIHVIFVNLSRVPERFTFFHFFSFFTVLFDSLPLFSCIRYPDHPALSESLYRLSYRGPYSFMATGIIERSDNDFHKIK
jgi:hypothetical protein